MQKSRVRRAGALLVGLALVAAACGDDDAESTDDGARRDRAAGDTTPATETTGRDHPTGHRSPGRPPPRRLPAPPAGRRRRTRGHAGHHAQALPMSPAWIGGVNDFWVAKGNPELTDFNYAAETYDAVIVIALAADGRRRRRQRARPTRSSASPRTARSAPTSPTAWRSSRPAATPTTTASPARSTSTATASRSRAATRMLEFGADNRIDDSPTSSSRRRVAGVGDRRPGSRSASSAPATAC